MKLILNDEFICTKKGDYLHVVSIFPDHNEIYKFQGKVADILEKCFQDKKVFNHQELGSLIGFSIDANDWKQLQDFLLEKKIIITE